MKRLDPRDKEVKMYHRNYRQRLFKGKGMIPADYVPGKIDFGTHTNLNFFNAAPIDTNFTENNKYLPIPPAPQTGQTPDEYYKMLWDNGYAIQPKGKELFTRYLTAIAKNFFTQQKKMLDQAQKNRELAEANEIIDTIDSALSMLASFIPGASSITDYIDAGYSFTKRLLPPDENKKFDYSADHMNILNQENIIAFRKDLDLYRPYQDLLTLIKTPKWYQCLQSRAQVKPDVSIFAPGGMK